MGVNANFQADFTTFNNAVDLAIVKLADFGKGAADVEQKLNNMVDKWSGRALIQQASELVVAINKVGGATALTTTEQQKLNVVLQEALAKYKAMGETVPPEVQKLADTTKRLADEAKSASTATSSMVPSLGEMAAAAAAAFSVTAIVNWVGRLVDGASQLNTLSAQTRISVEELQVLTAATSSYGVSSDELGRSLFALQAKIAGGDASVVSAYAAMGIKLDDIRNKNASELFIETERGLAGLTGGIRDAAAADLYGGKLGSSMAAFSTGADDAIEKAKRLNYITGTESVKAMADYGDSIARAKASIDAFATEQLGKLAQGFNTITDAVGKGATKWQLFKAGYLDWFGATTGLIGSTDHLATLLDHLNVATDANTAAAGRNAEAQGKVKVALDARAQATQFITTLEATAVAPLLDYQKEYLDRLNQIGQLNAQNAERIGVNVAQLEKYKKGLEEAKKAADDLKKSINEADQIAMDSYTKRIKSLNDLTQSTLAAYSFDGQIAQLEALKKAEEDLARAVYGQIDSEKVRMKLLDDLAAKRTAIDAQETALRNKRAKEVNTAVVSELEAQGRVLAAYGQNVDGTAKVESAQGKLQKALDALHLTKKEGVSQYYQEQELMDQFLKDQEAETEAVDAATEAKKRTKKATDDTAASLDRYTGSIALAAAATKSLSDQMDSYFPQGSNGSARLFMYGGATAGEAAYMAAGGIISGSIGGGITHRAGGGPVEAGMPYIVGERGPELFVPSQSGGIAPNGGGGLSVTVNINGSVLSTPSEIARVVGGAFMSVLRAQGTRLPVGAVGS